MRSAQSFPWTDEHIRLLRKLHGRGLTFGQITTQMGGGVTRNAVIGKAMRLGLPKRGGHGLGGNFGHRAPRRPKADDMPMGGDAVENVSPARDRAFAKDEQPVTPAANRKPSFASAPCTLLDLRADSCRWPLGEAQGAQTLFCGSDKVLGSYCATHARMAYRRPGSPDRAAEMAAMRMRRRAHAQKLVGRTS